MKKVFALCAVVIMLVVGIVPAFAETWAEESPVYGSTNGVWVGAPQDANLAYMRLQAQEAVVKAYDLGLFGGLYPVAIFVRSTNSGDAFCIQVMTPMGNTEGGMTSAGIVPNLGSQKFNGYSITQYGPDKAKYDDRIYLQNSTSVTGTHTSSWVIWTLRQSGDWTPSFTGTSANYIPLSSANLASGTGITKIMVSMNPFGNEPFYWFDYPVASAYKVGWASGVPIGNTLDSVIAKYDEQLALLEYVPPDPVPPTVSYQLDIPAIFDGYFAGVRDTLGAFDINLFGINIIGVLVAFLVIAIVAFVVRKLWK